MSKSEAPNWWNQERSASLVVPPALHDHIREIANRHNITDDAVLRQIITTGLIVIEGIDQRGDEFVLRSKDGEETKVGIFDDQSPLDPE